MILAIDSAPNRTGWALVDRPGPREEIVAYGALDTVNGKVVRDFIAQVFGPTTRPITSVAIEDAYLDKNPQTLKSLSQLVGRWMQEIDRFDVPIRLVMADVWQRQILTGFITNDSPRAARKRAAKLWVKAVFGIEVDENEADAICMGVWATRRGAFDRKIAAARR